MTKTLSTSKKAIAQRGRREAKKAAKVKESAPVGATRLHDESASTLPPPAYFAKRAEAIAAAKTIFGPDAEEKVDFVIAKLARKAPNGGVYYWVGMAEADAQWNNRQRHEAGLPPKPRAAAKTAAAPRAAKVTSGEPKATGVEALIAMARDPAGATVQMMKDKTGLKDPATGLRDACKARGVRVELIKGANGAPSRYFVRAAAA